MENTDKTEQAVDKLMGIRAYTVAVRMTGYYNIVVKTDDRERAEQLAQDHIYTWEDLSYQGDVEIDHIEEIEND